VPASYAEDDLAEGRAALLSGWSSGSEPGLVITRASGALVWDSKGNEYIDCTSMAWSNNIGASVPEVVEAAFAQARQLSHLRSNFDSIPLLLLSKAMTESARGPQADRIHPPSAGRACSSASNSYVTSRPESRPPRKRSRCTRS
jgi:4-aminobutyrate aminotransferase-like enzyme